MFNIQSGIKTHLPAIENSYSAFEVSPNTSQIFLSEYSLNPKIRIFNEKFEETQVISDVCEFEIMDMIYDHHKQYLYLICGSPDFKIQIIDIAKSARVIFKDDHNMTINEDFIKFAISPKLRRQICVMDKKQIIFYNIDKCFKSQVSGLEECLSFELICMPFSDIVQNPLEKEEFCAIYWDVSGKLYIGTTQSRMIIFCTDRMEFLEEVSFENAISFISRTQNDLYVLNNSK